MGEKSLTDFDAGILAANYIKMEEELYVVPERRSQGIGEKLFRFVENTVKTEAEYMVLSTATKNWKAIFHFYLDELDMTFWSARLFKKIE